MKKIIFCFIVLLIMHATVFAADVNVQINGENINFTDSEGNTVNAQTINSRTMVPMRKIFEVLGAEIEWDGENKIVKGKKGDVLIELQIDNNIASKTLNGEKKEIVLDAPPTLVNNRTMVPLRFIAESLDKQVGWDNANKTAIIIDYNYFLERLKVKFPELYGFLIRDYEEEKNREFAYYNDKFTHKYYDLTNPTNNTDLIISAKGSVKNNLQKITLTILGNSELSKEIISEDWNSTMFDLTYNENGITFSTENLKLIKMFGIKKNEILKTYEELNLDGNSTISLDEMFKIWANIDDTEININTFSELKNDFESLCSLFKVVNDTANQTVSYSTAIRYANYNIKYFDLAKLDNFVFDNEHSKIFNSINKLFFKTDVLKDEMLYDNSNIKIKIDALKDGSKIVVTIDAEGKYDEKNEYILEFERLFEK